MPTTFVFGPIWYFARSFACWKRLAPSIRDAHAGDLSCGVRPGNGLSCGYLPLALRDARPANMHLGDRIKCVPRVWQ
jgi:hypothetical protein